MAVTNYWLAAPSVAPTRSDSTAGTFQICHRRVNPDGTYTAPSPILTNCVLPNTITPQSYANSDVFRDEFLVSNDGGSTWRIVPRTAPLTGSQLIPSFSNSWTVASLTDTQESAATSVNFGSFLVSDSQVKTIWIINRTQDISTLNFSVLDQTDALTDALNGILEISITGVGNDTGNGSLNTSFNATKRYDRTVLNSGRFTLTANNPSAIKITLQLRDYPLTGLSENIDYQLSIVANQSNQPSFVKNPVRVGRIIDSISDEGISDGYVQDSDGIYVYLTTGNLLTIGSSASGASIAENWTDKLYELIWQVYNTDIYDSSGSPTTKGSSASADYSANKRLAVPDLTNRTTAGRSSTNQLGSFAGSDSLTLAIANLPSHNHSLSNAGDHTHTLSTAGNHTHTTTSDGSHLHSVSLTTGVESANHTHGMDGSFFAGAGSVGGSFMVSTVAGSAHRLASVTTGASNSHTHSVSGNTANAGSHTHTLSTTGDHTHTLSTTGDHTHTVGNTGDSEPIDNRQRTTYVHKLISTGY